MAKKRADELYERISKGEVDDYFRVFNETDFKAMATAIADDDVDKMLNILIKNLKKSKEGFMTPLASGSYDAEVRELSQRILSREIKRIKRTELREFVEEEPETETIIFPSKEEKAERKLLKKVGVRLSLRQKSHRRTSPKKFTTREIKFFQSRGDLTGSQIYKQYFDNFGNVRTKRSIKTKFYRVR